MTNLEKILYEALKEVQSMMDNKTLAVMEKGQINVADSCLLIAKVHNAILVAEAIKDSEASLEC